eukprot:1882600-Rhodomonas_salina.1
MRGGRCCPSLAVPFFLHTRPVLTWAAPLPGAWQDGSARDHAVSRPSPIRSYAWSAPRSFLLFREHAAMPETDTRIQAADLGSQDPRTSHR